VTDVAIALSQGWRAVHLMRALLLVVGDRATRERVMGRSRA